MLMNWNKLDGNATPAPKFGIIRSIMDNSLLSTWMNSSDAVPTASVNMPACVIIDKEKCRVMPMPARKLPIGVASDRSTIRKPA